MARSPKLIYRFNTISNKIAAGLFAETDKMILKSVWKFKVPRMARTVLKRTDLEGSYFLISKLTTKLQQSGQHGTGLRRDRQINGIELSTEINPHIYDQLIFLTKVSRHFNGEITVFSTNGARTCKRMRLDPYLTQLTNNASQT